MRALNRLALALFALTVTMMVSATLLGLGLEPAYDLVAFFLIPLSMATAGLLIASRQPSNPIGWLFCAIAVLSAIQELAQGYGVRAAAEGLPAGEIGDWAAVWTWIPSVPLLALVFLLFPNGRLPSRRWRVVPAAAFVGCALAVPGQALSPGIGVDIAGGENPFAVEGAAIDLLAWLGMALVSVALVASAVSLIFRFRRARGVERQQLKWFALAAAFLGIVGPLSTVLWSLTPLAQVLIVFPLAAIPAAAGVAILRYRLYEVDLVINRALVYGALTATLAGAYLATVVLLQVILSPLTEGSSLAVAASTLAVAALFRPARGGIQVIVDRRFYRQKYDAARTLERFGWRTRDEVDLDALASELRAVVGETMQPAHVSLWLRAPPQLARTRSP